MISVKQLNSKRTAWAQKWKTWKVLYDHGAWGFDEATGMLTADDETWTNAINADPNNIYIGFFRRKALRWREEIEQVYSGMYATGEFARGPDDDYPPASKRARKGDDQIVGSVQAVADRCLSQKTVEDAIELLDEVADEWSDTEYFVAVSVVSQNSGIWCALKPKRRMAWLHNKMDEYRAVCKSRNERFVE
jgi:NOL1/NOP2/fmu family ribosome biogenesis protein